MTVREFAAAKVNLFLHVLGRRPDGYHELDSLVVFASVGDDIELSMHHEHVISVEGPFADAVPHDESNLAMQAARQLGETMGRPDGVHIRITKNLPVAAGLGGGSADAAAVLRGLGRLWEVGPSMAFPSVAQTLGADVPVCLHSRAARIGGIGETVEPIQIETPLALVLVNCGTALATPDVFAACSTYGGAAPDLTDAGIAAWVRAGRNDLEGPAMSLADGVAESLKELRGQAGCGVARLSGSGATCFGLFKDMTAAQKAAAALGAAHPDWWVVAAHAR